MRIKITILVVSLIFAQFIQAKEICVASRSAPPDQTLVGWVTNKRVTTQWSGSSETKTTSLGEFRLVAVIKDGVIKEASDILIKEGQKFWVAGSRNKTVSLVGVESFLDQMGDDHCVYFASISEKTYPIGTLFTNKPDNRFKKPTQKDIELFNKLNRTCVSQGDYPQGKEPPCTKPNLQAVSDINNNKRLEYWATEPNTWDDSLTVWEIKNNKLIKLLDVCVGCSD